MKKTLKLVAIFIGVLVLGIVGGVSGYLIVSKNKTYYIFDVRIVEPVSEADTYIYVNPDRKDDYVSIKSKRVYMTTESENFIEIAVYAYTSNKSKNVSIKSSNTDVAKIVFKNNKCYVNYLKAGRATITSEIGGVQDSFNLEVYNQSANEFNVYDYKYYGEYAKYFPNEIICYSDMTEYAYDYKAYSASGESAGDVLNNDLLRIDEATLTQKYANIFESVRIDAENHTLNVKCKSNLTTTQNAVIPVQSYYYDDDGVIRETTDGNFEIKVKVVTYVPEFLQMELATTPDFEDNYIFMDTTVIDDSHLTEEVIKNDRTILDEYLAYQKAEKNLVSLNEKAVYQTLFTDKVTKIYVKFRKVYTNGDIVYLDPTAEGNPFSLVTDNSHFSIAPTQDFYVISLTKDYFETNTSFNITLTLGDYDLAHTFKFEFASYTKANIDLFYDYDEVLKIYTYDYWDLRARYDNEIYDADGNVVGFYELGE